MLAATEGARVVAQSSTADVTTQIKRATNGSTITLQFTQAAAKLVRLALPRQLFPIGGDLLPA